MKYTVTIIILLIGLCLSVTFLKSEYTIALEVLLMTLTYITFYVWEYSVINTTFDSNFKIRSQKKTISIFDIGIALFLTFQFLIFSDFYLNHDYLILILWITPIIESIMWFIYKSKNPYTIFINGNQLIVNRRWVLKRNLNELTQIHYDRFSKNLELNFKTKREISIKTTEYKVDDILQLLEKLIETSENNVFIPLNYTAQKKKTNALTLIRTKTS
ncbi:hypothetical protein [Olleya sp. Bg11-27]|uniref:hypothetical protein n=1 Tax=Olleya sp. Bg11-27 TaxID=2058135 RepID=UPI000C3026CF|nr:hypothetical protein [Olleya sp. Bg11-27]AUC75759.1 hypothetical protein CW732_08750 [Olleya sp. Bg11-27]